MQNATSKTIFNKNRKKLIPLLFILYIVAYLDRINVSFAQLQMSQDLGFSDAVYGFGSGIFFIGYFLLEVPSNLILQKVGAKLWIARIMLTWGLIAIAMMFVRNEHSFYLLRFLLGAAEAGFFPGVILYLSYWFPNSEIAKTNALFVTAACLAGVIGGPISGALLSLDNIGGLEGWQWLFLLEGIPATLLSAVVIWYLPNSPHDAPWLDTEEKAWLADRLIEEKETIKDHQQHQFSQLWKNPRIWGLSFIYFTICVGLYGVGFWLPQLLKRFSTMTDWQVGLVSVIPYLFATVGMILIGSHSDRTGERRWHIAIPLLVAAIAMAISSMVDTPIPLILGLILVCSGVWGAIAPFWSVPPTFLSGTAAAGGIALINSIGNLGGFVGPFLVGLVKQLTNSFSGGLLTISFLLFLGACVAVYCTPFQPISKKIS